MFEDIPRNLGPTKGFRCIDQGLQPLIMYESSFEIGVEFSGHKMLYWIRKSILYKLFLLASDA